MRKLLVVLALLAVSAAAQSLDFAAGLGAVKSSDVGGGLWGSGSVTLRLLAGAALNVEDAVRANAKFGNHYQLMDFNFVGGIPNPTRLKPEFMLGFARERGLAKCSNCIVSPNAPAPPGQTWYNGFHFGADLKIYTSGHFFFRPEYHFYYFDDAARVSRFALSIGYTFGGLL